MSRTLDIVNVSGYGLDCPAYGVVASSGETITLDGVQAMDLLQQSVNWAPPPPKE